jgi:hypothetical protein
VGPIDGYRHNIVGHGNDSDERAGKADTNDFRPETPLARSVILRVRCKTDPLRGAAGSMAMAGHTGHLYRLAGPH